MQIQLIRSATLKLTLGGQTFLIDPWLAGKNCGMSYSGKGRSPLVELPLPVEQILNGVDAVIVSHLHSDHWDETARQAIRPAIPILCHARDVDFIRQQGFADVRAITGQIHFNQVLLSATKGRHGPPEIIETMGPVSGFMFRAPGEPSLYWAGDTILCPEVRDIIANERPDVVVVHACGAVWDGIEPLVMDIGMTLETVKIAEPAMVIATHLDAVDHATVTRASLKSACCGDQVATRRLLVPEDGEIMTFVPTDLMKPETTS